MDIVNGVADVTPDLLTEVLRNACDQPALRVINLRASPLGNGQMADSFRLEIRYAEPILGAPPTLIAKLTSSDSTSRHMAVTMSAYLREVRFYQHLEGLINTRVPRCYLATVSADRAQFVLLLEDVSPTKSIDQLSHCSVDDAALALDQAAGLHGPAWGHAILGRESWLPTDALARELIAAIPDLVDPWLGRFGDRLDDTDVGIIRRLGVGVHHYLPTFDDHRTLQHGDFRLDNLLFAAQPSVDPLTVIDWQSTSVAPGIADVSYFVGTSLTPTDRIAHERDLVAEYHSRLLSHGVSNYSFEQCWREYRAHAIYGLILAIPTSLGVERTERGDEMFATMVRRVIDQVAANDSFTALETM